ncbi:MATE efflux family protein [Zostera marina]|uniref:Protein DETOXIFICATION n=1 Tax=Zostera marina TaxID=29655 RepID=A0A0K9NTK6_ZOSMR|nr:MATE efflux family protein [Zostera marina]
MCNIPAANSAADKNPSPPNLDVTITTSSSSLGTGTNTINELGVLFSVAFPIALTALILYSRSVVSMLFLGTLGELSLAGGSLAIAFANITAYAILAGLSLGMDPLCSQAFGANNSKLLTLTLHRSILFLLCSSLPISLLWLHVSKILLFIGQDREITAMAQTYVYYCLPDLISFSLIHPIRIYLRSQSITAPLTLSAIFAAIVHLPANFLLVTHLGFGISGVAAASAFSNFMLLIFLLIYIKLTGTIQNPTWTWECFAGWSPLIRLAAPSCVSVCLEWWWYEIMILLCGLLPNSKSAVASMGVLIQATSLLYVFPSSLGLGVSTRVGNELGGNQPSAARASSHVAFYLSAVMGLLSMVFAMGMKEIWGKLFTNDVEILRLSMAALPIIGLCELGNCPQTVGCGVLRGCARPRAAVYVNLGGFYLVGMMVAVGVGFVLDVGFCGIWMGLLAAQVTCAGLMAYVVRTTNWEAEAKKAQLLAMVRRN